MAMRLPKLTQPWVNRESSWGSGHARYSIGAQDEKGRRYHAWVYGPKHVTQDDVLYFNAPMPNGKPLHAGDRGHFPTRTLDTSEGRGKAILDNLRSICTLQGLFDEADRKEEQRAIDTRERQKAAHELHLKREAAEELFAFAGPALEHLEAMSIGCDRKQWSSLFDLIDAGKAAILKATTDPQPSKEPY